MKEEVRFLTLVHHIPMRALPLIPPHDLIDMIRHDRHQCRVVINAVNPTRQLGVPNQGVTSHLLLILRREVRNRISTTPGERPSGWFRGIPLHCIFRCDGPELCALDEVLLRVVGADSQRGADVGAALGNDGGVERGGLSSFVREGGDGGHAGSECQGVGEGCEQHRGGVLFD